jgi:hypothetical protein
VGMHPSCATFRNSLKVRWHIACLGEVNAYDPIQQEVIAGKQGIEIARKDQRGEDMCNPKVRGKHPVIMG